jgi:hypothetical protein
VKIGIEKPYSNILIKISSAFKKGTKDYPINVNNLSDIITLQVLSKMDNIKRGQKTFKPYSWILIKTKSVFPKNGQYKRGQHLIDLIKFTGLYKENQKFYISLLFLLPNKPPPF